MYKTSSEEPPGPENTRFVISKQSIPSTNVPDPDGIDEPENEKASTVPALAETVKPFAAASPPFAPDAHPS